MLTSPSALFLAFLALQSPLAVMAAPILEARDNLANTISSTNAAVAPSAATVTAAAAVQTTTKTAATTTKSTTTSLKPVATTTHISSSTTKATTTTTTKTTTSAPAPTSTCPVVDGLTSGPCGSSSNYHQLVYSACGTRGNPAALDITGYAHKTYILDDWVDNACSAVFECDFYANQNGPFGSFDVYYQISEGMWRCNLHAEPVNNPQNLGAVLMHDSDAGPAYLYTRSH